MVVVVLLLLQCHLADWLSWRNIFGITFFFPKKVMDCRLVDEHIYHVLPYFYPQIVVGVFCLSDLSVSFSSDFVILVLGAVWVGCECLIYFLLRDEKRKGVKMSMQIEIQILSTVKIINNSVGFLFLLIMNDLYNIPWSMPSFVHLLSIYLLNLISIHNTVKWNSKENKNDSKCMFFSSFWGKCVLA